MVKTEAEDHVMGWNASAVILNVILPLIILTWKNAFSFLLSSTTCCQLERE